MLTSHRVAPDWVLYRQSYSAAATPTMLSSRSYQLSIQGMTFSQLKTQSWHYKHVKKQAHLTYIFATLVFSFYLRTSQVVNQGSHGYLHRSA